MKANWTRREFVQRVGTAAGVLALGGTFAEFLAACGGSATTSGSKLEIFSWWTAGGEADGLAEMFKIYKAKYPSVAIQNAAVAGGAGRQPEGGGGARLRGGEAP